MKKINLMDIEHNFDEIALMKHDIESLNEDGEKMTLSEFFSTMKVYSTIFMYKGIIIPFSIMDGKDETYFVYCVSTVEYANNNLKKTNEAIGELERKLMSIGYDLSKLDKKTVLDMSKLSEDLMNSAVYFIIDNEYYI